MRRSLGDGFDERMQLGPASFAAMVDGRHIMVCGLWDNSFRIISTTNNSTNSTTAGSGAAASSSAADAANTPAGGAARTTNNRLVQAVYGHYGVVTCLCRSESNIASDCYVASGSADCTVLLWIWSAKQQRICGDPYTFYDVSGRARVSPIPKATLTGHESAVIAIALSADLGFVFSSSAGSSDNNCGGCVLQHTTGGELLRSLQLSPSPSIVPGCPPRQPRQLAFSREGSLLVLSDAAHVTLFSLNGQLLKSRTNIFAEDDADADNKTATKATNEHL